MSKAIAASKERFRPDLASCVAENDPGHLYELNDGGEYRISGWFISIDRTIPVRDCMIRKGWQPFPK